MFKRTLLFAALGHLIAQTSAVHGRNVAVIDNDNQPITEGMVWCEFLMNNGHTCTLFPMEGPSSSLDSFDVVVDLSPVWTDSTGLLPAILSAGKTVITGLRAPAALSLDTDPTVRAWIGANSSANASGNDNLVTTASDPVVGNISPGTEIVDCDGGCSAVRDPSGHPGAKVLALFMPLSDPYKIGILRNDWESGLSIFISDIAPHSNDAYGKQIALAAVTARPLVIPTVTSWGLLAMTLGLLIVGTIVIRRLRHGAISLIIATFLFGVEIPTSADVSSITTNGVTYLRLNDNDPFHSTNKTVANLRAVAIPDSSGLAALWEEVDPNATPQPYYAISLDETNVDEIRTTSYHLFLRYARFDPAVAQPTIDEALSSDPDGELFIVQFVTQPLSAFRSAIRTEGAIIYDFLPNHAYIARLTDQSYATVAALPFVRAVSPYHPAYRLEPYLVENLAQTEQFYPSQRYNICVSEPSHKAVLAEQIASVGGIVDSPDAGKRMVVATLTSAQLQQVVRFDEVLFIDRWGTMEPDMDNARVVSGVNDLETAGNYRGVGVRGEVLDCAFNPTHGDLGSSESCPRDLLTDTDLQHGGAVSLGNHGAQTSTIIFGNGTGESARTGILPCGQGIIADLDNIDIDPSSPTYNRYNHTGELVNPTLSYQAVFQSTSAGIGSTTSYDTISAEMDHILFDFDLLHCQSQGNNGDPDDLEESKESRSQAWAKNTISVGGVRHFETPDLSNDRWCGGTTGCGVSLGACASIGPATDGRIKPDLAHFVDCIDTGYCCTAGGLCGVCQTCDQSYPVSPGVFSGTSAATPIVCGLAGLLMEMWADDSDSDGKNIFGVAVPSCNPATENCVFKRRPHMTTAKAMLINTANQYDWITGCSGGSPPPNCDITRNAQGWGVPNVKNVYDLRQKMVIINETQLLLELGAVVYNVKVNTGEPFLKATLVYADPPGTTSSTIHRINDLGLKVISPSGTVYWGNYGLVDGYGLSAGLWSVADTNPTSQEKDDHNTVENVFVQNPAAGLWKIRVRVDELAEDGHVETPGDDADFALVVSGALPTGACYVPETECFITDRADCLAQGGTYGGDHAACNPA